MTRMQQMPDDDSLDALTDRLNAAYPYGHEPLSLRSMIKLNLWLMREAMRELEAETKKAGDRA